MLFGLNGFNVFRAAAAVRPHLCCCFPSLSPRCVCLIHRVTALLMAVAEPATFLNDTLLHSIQLPRSYTLPCPPPLLLSKAQHQWLTSPVRKRSGLSSTPPPPPPTPRYFPLSAPLERSSSLAGLRLNGERRALTSRRICVSVIHPFCASVSFGSSAPRALLRFYTMRGVADRSPGLSWSPGKPAPPPPPPNSPTHRRGNSDYFPLICLETAEVCV